MRRASPDATGSMAAESGNDSQLRRRRHRDTEETEEAELSGRDLTAAESSENNEENEERWVGPLPVEATLAKKRKGSCSERLRAPWDAESAEGEG